MNGVPKSLLTLSDVADIFGVKTSTVARWVREGRIEALTTPGGQYRVRRAEVDRMTAPPAAEATA